MRAWLCLLQGDLQSELQSESRIHLLASLFHSPDKGHRLAKARKSFEFLLKFTPTEERCSSIYAD